MKKNTIAMFGSTINKNKINDVNCYNYPIEKKYSGNFRKDNKYGPYGTDNYHNEDTFSDELNEIEKSRVNIYRDLASRYYPAQRSKRWFDMRNKMITASDGGSIVTVKTNTGTIVTLNPYEGSFAFIVNKVYGKPFNTNEDCYHGKKYEQVATMAYEYRMNVRVKEFGLCQHKKYYFLGASPDGIVSEYKLRTKDGRS